MDLGFLKWKLKMSCWWRKQRRVQTVLGGAFLNFLIGFFFFFCFQYLVFIGSFAFTFLPLSISVVWYISGFRFSLYLSATVQCKQDWIWNISWMGTFSLLTSSSALPMGSNTTEIYCSQVFLTFCKLAIMVHMHCIYCSRKKAISFSLNARTERNYLCTVESYCIL